MLCVFIKMTPAAQLRLEGKIFNHKEYAIPLAEYVMQNYVFFVTLLSNIYLLRHIQTRRRLQEMFLNYPFITVK